VLHSSLMSTHRFIIIWCFPRSHSSSLVLDCKAHFMGKIKKQLICSHHSFAQRPQCHWHTDWLLFWIFPWSHSSFPGKINIAWKELTRVASGHQLEQKQIHCPFGAVALTSLTNSCNHMHQLLPIPKSLCTYTGAQKQNKRTITLVLHSLQQCANDVATTQVSTSGSKQWLGHSSLHVTLHCHRVEGDDLEDSGAPELNNLKKNIKKQLHQKQLVATVAAMGMITCCQC